MAREAVASTPHGERQAMLPAEVDRPHYVGDTGATSNQGRSAIEHSIPQPTRLVIPVIAGTQEPSPKTSLELVDHCISDA